MEHPSARCRQALPDLEPITPSHLMPTKPSIWEFLPQPERDHIPPRERQDRQVWPGYWIYHNRDDSISFGTEQRDYFGWLPAEITRAVPESVINTIASRIRKLGSKRTAIRLVELARKKSESAAPSTTRASISATRRHVRILRTRLNPRTSYITSTRQFQRLHLRGKPHPDSARTTRLPRNNVAIADASILSVLILASAINGVFERRTDTTSSILSMLPSVSTL
jgi:hypothetical protein